MIKGSYVLTESQRWRVARAYEAGRKVRDIASEFGISINAVSAIAINRGFRRRHRRSGTYE